MAETFDSTGRQDLIDDSTPDAVEIAQAVPGGEPIGQVETLAGTVVAVRADGSRVELEVGDSIFQGDTLESGNDGAIGVVLADQTTFSMAENGQMVMDEMVYDPGSGDGSIAVSVLQGVFTFVSGEIAKTDPDAMTLATPVATIGIRGTQVALSYDPADTGGDGLKIVLMEEKDGFVGEVVVQNAAGLQVLNLADQGTTVISATAAPAQPIQFDRSDIVNAFGGALGALPASANANTYGVEPTTEEGALEEEAGEEEATEEELVEDEAAEEEHAEVEVEEELAEVEVEEEFEEEIAEEGEEEIEEEFAEEGEENIEELAEVETAAGGDADFGGDGDFNVTGDFGTGGSTAAEDAAADAAAADAAAQAAADAAAADAAAAAAAAAEALRQATADEPALTVGPASGDEDQVGGIALDISAVSTDTVGNETLSVTISGLPTGATLSAGTPNVDGTWTLTADQLSGLTVIPADDYYGDFELSVTATSTVSDREDGDLASTFGTIAVSVAAVNDAPEVDGTVSFSMDEDGTLIFSEADLLAGSTDADGDTLSAVNLVVNGGDGTLTDNGGGTWTFTPTADFFGDVTLSYDVSDGQLTDSTTATITVNDLPEAEAEAPAPTAQDDTIITNIVDGSTIAISSDWLLANDSPVAGGSADDLLIASVSTEQTLGFESGDFTDWQTIGSAQIVSSHYTGYPTYVTFVPTEGVDMASLTAAGSWHTAIADFLYVNEGQFLSAATDGSAISTKVMVSAGDTITFDWMFDAADYGSWNDAAFFTTDAGEVFKLADVATVGSRQESGWQTYTYTATTSGELVIGFTVQNYRDTAVDSKLLIDNVVYSGGTAGLVALEADGTIVMTPDATFPTVDATFGYTITDGVAESDKATVTVQGIDSDTLTGTDAGDDIIIGRGDNTLFGLAGDDFLSAGTGFNFLDGGQGNDVLWGSTALNTFSVLWTDDWGSESASGSYAYSELLGGEGGGSDELHGGVGDNWLDGGQGEDFLFGGSGGYNTISITDTLDDGTVVSGDFTYAFNYLDGGKGADELTGGDGFNYLVGGQGDDIITAGDGNAWSFFSDSSSDLEDFMPLLGAGDGNDDDMDPFDAIEHAIGDGIGTFGQDFFGEGGVVFDNILIGGQGVDTLIGGAGNDIMIGGDFLGDGSGADTFIVGAGGGSDVITDFSFDDALVFTGFSAADVTDTVDAAGNIIIGVGSGADRVEVTLENTAGSGYTVSTNEDIDGNAVVTIDPALNVL